VKAIKSDKAMSKNRGVTPSVAAPGVTHPTDATDVVTLTKSNVPVIIFMAV